jgi:hypothetical protein
MSEEACSCALLLEEVNNKKIAHLYLNAFAEEMAIQRAHRASLANAKAIWQAEVTAIECRTLKKVIINDTLCKECVVERPILAVAEEVGSDKYAPPQATTSTIHYPCDPW